MNNKFYPLSLANIIEQCYLTDENIFEILNK